MKVLNLPLEGSCRCGHVRIEVSAPPLLTMACHCNGCQRMSSSAYSLSAAIPSEGFKVTKGETVLGGASPEAGHHFCPDCMTWMFTRTPGLEWFVNVRPTMLDDTLWFEPFLETYTRTKLPWVTVPATHSFEAFPPLEAYETFISHYQTKAGRVFSV